MDQGGDIVGLESRDIHVPPNAMQLAVVGAQLCHLTPHEPEILFDVMLRGVGQDLVVSSQIRVVRVVPVHNGVVELKRDAAAMACLGDLRQDVLAVGRIPDGEVGLLRVPKAEAIVVLDREDQILHSAFRHRIQPGRRMEAARIECEAVSVVFLPGAMISLELLLMESADGIDPPMDEQPETGTQKPVASVAEGAGTTGKSGHRG